MKIKLGIMFGGKSEEHEISLMSAAAILKAINKDKYEVFPIGITQTGRLASAEETHRMLPASCLNYLNDPVIIQSNGREDKLVTLGNSSSIGKSSSIDVIFPVLHGPYGEDGTIQGLLELTGIPYVGCGTLSSALGMDKVFMKKIWTEAGLPVIEYLWFLTRAWKAKPKQVIETIEERIAYPNFVKPANLGSSIGVTKVKNRAALSEAINLAGKYDKKILVERALDARELECGVLGNDFPAASQVGEVVPARDFYDYEAKYNDPRTQLIIPAVLDQVKTEEIRNLSIEAFRALECSGLARVDFLMERNTNTVYLNEINTMPGFTAISMYPRLWESSGIPFSDLIDRLIDLAFERHNEKTKHE